MAESASDLQYSLKRLKEYCDTWKLRINVDKTKLLIFSRKRQIKNVNFVYNNSAVEIINDFNYQGAYFYKS